MKPTLVRTCVAVAISGALIGAVSLVNGPDGYAQEPKAAPARGTESLSPLHCIGCHGGPGTLAYDKYNMAEKTATGEKTPRTDFILLTEYNTWAKDDLHAQAHDHINPKSSKLAERIQDVLSQSPSRTGKGYRVDAAAECLTCHAVDREPGLVSDPALAAGDRFQTMGGVSCEGCHGQVSEAWFGKHVQRDWREQTPAVKAAAGQVDLRDPHKRAEKCASCHVGNKAEGKFVTHEMYAAGHPPLPPFELVTFCRDEPRHYHTAKNNKELLRMARDKDTKAKARVLFHFTDPDEDNPEARSFAVGTVSTFEATMKLLAKDAEDTKDGILDFAHFDCYACHHDLAAGDSLDARAGRERRRPRDGVVPGRPVMRPWAKDSVLAVLANAKAPAEKDGKAEEEFTKAFAELTSAFNDRPFGVNKRVSESATALAKVCATARPGIESATYSKERTKKLYDDLVQRVTALKAAKGPIDHDSAQLLAWGFVVLREAMAQKDLETYPPDLDDLVRLGIRGKKDVGVSERVHGRYRRIYDFDREPFFPALEAFVKSVGN